MFKLGYNGYFGYLFTLQNNLWCAIIIHFKIIGKNMLSANPHLSSSTNSAFQKLENSDAITHYLESCLTLLELNSEKWDLMSSTLEERLKMRGMILKSCLAPFKAIKGIEQAFEEQAVLLIQEAFNHLSNQDIGQYIPIIFPEKNLDKHIFLLMLLPEIDFRIFLSNIVISLMTIKIAFEKKLILKEPVPMAKSSNLANAFFAKEFEDSKREKNNRYMNFLNKLENSMLKELPLINFSRQFSSRLFKSKLIPDNSGIREAKKAGSDSKKKVFTTPAKEKKAANMTEVSKSLILHKGTLLSNKTSQRQGTHNITNSLSSCGLNGKPPLKTAREFNPRFTTR